MVNKLLTKNITPGNGSFLFDMTWKVNGWHK